MDSIRRHTHRPRALMGRLKTALLATAVLGLPPQSLLAVEVNLGPSGPSAPAAPQGQPAVGQNGPAVRAPSEDAGVNPEVKPGGVNRDAFQNSPYTGSQGATGTDPSTGNTPNTPYPNGEAPAEHREPTPPPPPPHFEEPPPDREEPHFESGDNNLDTDFEASSEPGDEPTDQPEPFPGDDQAREAHQGGHEVSGGDNAESNLDEYDSETQPKYAPLDLPSPGDVPPDGTEEREGNHNMEGDNSSLERPDTKGATDTFARIEVKRPVLLASATVGASFPSQLGAVRPAPMYAQADAKATAQEGTSETPPPPEKVTTTDPVAPAQSPQDDRKGAGGNEMEPAAPKVDGGELSENGESPITATSKVPHKRPSCAAHGLPDVALGLGLIAVIPTPMTAMVSVVYVGGKFWGCYQAMSFIDATANPVVTLPAQDREAAKREILGEVEAGFRKVYIEAARQIDAKKEEAMATFDRAEKTISDRAAEEKATLEKVGARTIKELYDEIESIRSLEVEIKTKERDAPRQNLPNLRIED